MKKVELPFAGVTQQGHSLCWAACVESAIASVSGTTVLSQPRLAHRFIRSCDVELDRRTIRGSRCDEAIPVGEMLFIWRSLGFSKAERRPIPNDLGKFLVSELANGRPVQVWVDEYHGVMVYGYEKTLEGKERVLIMNPQPGIGNGWYSLRSHSRWSAVWSGLDFKGAPHVWL